MEWEDAFNVGEQGIDIQHRGLVRIINDMYDTVMGCQSLEEERELTGNFLEKLCKYADIHFQDEESLLIQQEYPDIARHKSQHADFIKELKRLQDEYGAGVLALSFDVFKFASNWLATHIKQSDQKYVTYLK
jgi:hemerythrin